MNATLQCLSNTASLRTFFAGGPDQARGEPQVLARSCLACLVVLLACSGAFALSLLAEVALEPTGQLSVAVEGDARCSAD